MPWQAPSELWPTVPPPEGDGTLSGNMESSIRTLGLEAMPLSASQASLILAARDFADEIMRREKGQVWHYKEARLRLIGFLLRDAGQQAFLQEWSWKASRSDRASLPRNDFTASAKQHLADLIAGIGR